MNTCFFILRLLRGIIALCFCNTVEAGSPLWTVVPLTATTVSVPSNDTATVHYQVTNQSTRIHTLTMQSIPGITQLTTGLGVCGNPFTLTAKASCKLSLQVNGSQLAQSISDGPILCEQGSALPCYRPTLENTLHITQADAITDAAITVTGSPATLTTNGPTGTLIIHNTSLIVAATNITSNFIETTLDGNVTETGNTCVNVAPLGSCTLTYTPGSNVVSQTSFSIQGSNTNAVPAAIQIDTGVTLSNVSPSSGTASGGTGVTLTGIGLTGATSVTFGGVAASSVNVVNSTTVTAVTPELETGAVEVVITTPSGIATDTNGYTYLPTSIGQAAYGGTIACLNGNMNNLIAATGDNSMNIPWGGLGKRTSATSITDGATNTATILTAVGANGGTSYAAQLCSHYEVDSQGNTPCESGNTCYNDWFLPAGNNTGSSGQLNCLYTNHIVVGGFASAFYWSSTELDPLVAWHQSFMSGSPLNENKSFNRRVRCVREFSP